jgi:two-component system alkaline phosphatase synthesis response regulator PhoP
MLRVLVIDDEPDVLLLCRVNLRHAGHEVLEASNGEEGLALAREAKPDVIVLDLMLPRMDGYQVLERLAAEGTPSRMPILVLTAKAQEEDRERSRRMGADAFIEKPFSPETLADTVSELAGLPTEERARRRDRVLPRLD